MSTALVKHQQQQFTNEQLDLIRKVVARGTTPEQFKFFIEVCNHYRLNPIARQIYAVVRSDQLTIQTSIDGFRLMAERTGKYAGQLGPQWCGLDGEWVDVWLKPEPPAAARVGVLRRDFDHPVWGIARYTSYVQPQSPLWKKMPDAMLAKCSESLALRRAFPAEMSGIYTNEEMEQADREQPLPTINIQEVRDTINAQVEEIEQPATDQQIASIEKLCDRLKKPAPAVVTFNQARETIRQLTAEIRTVVEEKRQAQEPKAPAADQGVGMIQEGQMVRLLNLYEKLGQDPPEKLQQWSFDQAAIGLKELSKKLNEKLKAAKATAQAS